MDLNDNKNNAARSIQELEITIDNLIECAEYWIAKCKHLESEIARLERLSNG